MLSYILGMIYRFERAQGILPNLLYLNREHARSLCAELGGAAELKLSDQLGLTVMIYPGIVHPQVLYLFQSRSIVTDA